MPLSFQKKIDDFTTLGVWEIQESLEWFKAQFSISEDEANEIKDLSARKLLEWYAGRWLLCTLLNEKRRNVCLKDEHGKPYLVNSDTEISISHSADKVAVIISKLPVGIDIQYFTEKIIRIESKFMRMEEQQSLSAPFKLAHLHAYWGAKESLYKAYGKRQLDFKANILINPFEYIETGGNTQGQVIKGNFSALYHIAYQSIDNFSLTYCVLAPTL